MRALQKRAFGFVFAASIVALGAFQNCSKVDFKGTDGVSADGPTATSNSGSLTESFDVQTKQMMSKIDVLFVVDESSSMSAIIDQVTKNFENLNLASLPTDTQFAVTNTAPALFTAPNVFDPRTAFRQNNGNIFAKQPGFLKLVNASTVRAFTTAEPSYKSMFPHPGCAQSWFKLGDVDSSKASCLSGATQTAQMGIGAEVGTVSLEQLAITTKNASQRLFRSGALVNIIFVSDTHDPGTTSYYGEPGAPSARRLPADLVSLIQSANPGIAGVKFHAIAPLPTSPSDPVLIGLHYAGDLPTSQPTGEGTYGFSYLPFVKATGGLATNIVNKDWNSVTQAMADSTQILENPIVHLAHLALSIQHVRVGGVEIAASQYLILDGGATIQIQSDKSWPQTARVEVDYTYAL